MDSQIKLKVIVDNIEPYIGVRKINSSLEITGYMAELWNIIESKLNFKSSIIYSNFKDGKDMISNGSVDVLLIPVIVTETDVENFDYSFPVVKTWYELYIRREGSDATSVSYLETWGPGIWAAFLFTIIFLTFVLWSMLRVRKIYGLDMFEKAGSNSVTPAIQSPARYDQWRQLIQTYRSKNNYSSGRATNFLTTRHNDSLDLSSCFFIILGSVANQGFLFKTRSSSMRLVVLVTLLFGLVMFNSYSAVLVSRLAVGKPPILFPNLKSVAERATHTICVREQSYAYLLFKDNENDTELSAQWKPFVNQAPCKNTTKVEQIASALCKSKTVILEAPNIIASILEMHKHCTVVRMPGRYSTAYTSMLMRKNFQYRNEIDSVLHRISGSGVVDYLQKKWLSHQLPQSLPISNQEPVTMSHIKGILLVYSVAMFFCFICFLFERFSHKCKTNIFKNPTPKSARY